MNNASISYVKLKLNKRNAKKRFGQNFLIDGNIAKKICLISSDKNTKTIAVLLFQNTLISRIIINNTCKGLLKSIKMCSALMRINVICESQHAVRRKTCRSLHCNFNISISILSRKINWLI